MGKPLSTEEFIERHSALKQEQGFNIQFVAFVYYLLGLKAGDSIFYEKEDDIVVTLHDGARWLIQVKNSTDDEARITDADSDFWKTFGNWTELYKLSDDKETFLKAGNKFILFTNKEFANSFYNQIKQLQDGSIGIDEVCAFLEETEKTVSYYDKVQALLKLGKITLNRFLLKVEFVQVKDLLGDIYDTFLNQYYSPTEADKVFSELLGKMLKEKIESVQKGISFEYEKEDFIQQHKGILQYAYNEDLKPVTEKTNYPEDITEAPFMKRLYAIDAIENDSDKKVYLGHWLCFQNSMQRYTSIQLMTPELEKSISNTAFTLWHSNFKKHHIGIRKHSSEDKKIEAAQKCLYDMMEKNIAYSDSRFIRVPFSSGWFLDLTNDEESPTICWYINDLDKIRGVKS